MAGRALIKEADVVVNSNKKTYKVLLNELLDIDVIIGYPLLLMSFIYKYIINFKPPCETTSGLYN